VELAQDPHGTRAVQCLIHTLAMHPHYVADVQLVIEALEKNTIALIHSMHGNHVIQACLTNFSCTANGFVHRTILEYFVHVANNRYGCCVLQCCLKTANYDQYQELLTKLCENTLVLVKDAYGNYAVQFILDRDDPAMYTQMFTQMRGHIAQLSMQKFSSNVVEKGLRAEPEYADCANLIISELAFMDKTKALLHSPYGNYVIQKALMVPLPVTGQLAASIRPHLPALRSIPYGKKLEKLVKHACLAVEMGQPHMLQVDCAANHPWGPSFAPFIEVNHLTPAHGLIPMVPPPRTEGMQLQYAPAGNLNMPPNQNPNGSVPFSGPMVTMPPTITEEMRAPPPSGITNGAVGSQAPSASGVGSPPEGSIPVAGTAALFDPSSSIAVFGDQVHNVVQGLQASHPRPAFDAMGFAGFPASDQGFPAYPHGSSPSPAFVPASSAAAFIPASSAAPFVPSSAPGAFIPQPPGSSPFMGSFAPITEGGLAPPMPDDGDEAPEAEEIVLQAVSKLEIDND